MKKIITCVGGLALVLTSTSTVLAGAVDNKTNWSAEYIRTLNRNAATDYADIAMYNPAGTVKLEEGFTLNGSIQFLTKDYENNIQSGITETKLMGESDEPSYIPGIFGVYNREKWSLYGALSNIGGGGKVDYSKGNKTTYDVGAYLGGFYNVFLEGLFFADFSEGSLEGESYYLGYTLGGAYKFNDMVSVSLAARYVDASVDAKGEVTIIPIPNSGMHSLDAQIEFDQEADGWGGVIGMNIAPSDVLNIGIRYETEVDLDFKSKVLAGTNTRGEELVLPLIGISDGESVTRNLPAILGLGLSYKISDKLRVETNLTYYFNENADWDGAEDMVDNGYDIGIALEYIFNEKLLGSIGYLHTELGMDPGDIMSPENPELDANTLGIGIAYAFNEKLHTNISIGNAFYEDESFVSELTGAKVEYKKNVFFLALGLEYRFH